MNAPAPKSRWKWLLPALAATVVAVVWVEQQSDEQDVVAVAEPRKASRGSASRELRASEPKDTALIERIDRAALPAEPPGADPFAQASWQPKAPPAPPPPPPPPPPVPVAPPLPFSYFGQTFQDGRFTVFVSRQDRSFALQVGDTIENTWRVAEIRPPDLVLIYLPLNERQILKIGAAN